MKRQWICPGTHINAMGADTAGKQELDPELVAAATVIVDDVEQAISIGECQHAFKLGLISREDLRRTLGAVVAGAFARRSATEITLFDGTGIALQDLAGWRNRPIAGPGTRARGRNASCDQAPAQVFSNRVTPMAAMVTQVIATAIRKPIAWPRKRNPTRAPTAGSRVTRIP